MIFKAFKKDLKATCRIICQYDTDKSKPPYTEIEPGEWLVETNDGHREIHFCISKEWNLNAVAAKFRLLRQKTGKYWGSEPVLVTSLRADVLTAALRGVALADYAIRPSESHRPERSKLVLYIDAEQDLTHAIERATAEAEVQMWVMKMVDLPPNLKTPHEIGLMARQSAKKFGFSCEVWNEDHIIKGKLFALHAVGRGSANESAFIVSRYNGRPDSQEVDVTLVGKGITFDTGGISIKGSTNMHYMKSDMAGAAAMLGAIELAARFKLKLNIATIVPSAENSVDANAVLPGEIIESHSGKTIEVIDTDAEGRLALADGLSWSNQNLKPKIMIDMATLTGSSVRALGMEAAALYSDNKKLAESLQESGLKTGDKLWPMPLWSDYDSYIHSDVADVSNLPLKPVAGSIAAAKFLQFFTNGHTAWAHIDMPGMSFGDSPFYKTKSATGFGVQLLSDFLTKLSEDADIASY